MLVFESFSPVVGFVRIGRVGVCVLASVVGFLKGSRSEDGWWFGVDCIGGGDALVDGWSMSVDSRVCFSSFNLFWQH
jgi:hypothetical protein